MPNEEDAISVAGTDFKFVFTFFKCLKIITVFSEPWDSNAWDNLLDLARFGDEKSTTALAIKGLYYKTNKCLIVLRIITKYLALHSTETIVEEDDLSSTENLIGTQYNEEQMTGVVEHCFSGVDKFGSLPQNFSREKAKKSDKYYGSLGSRGSTPKNHHSRFNIAKKEIIIENDENISRPKISAPLNTEMEAVAMAAVLGGCCSRPVCLNTRSSEDDRISAAAKLASSALLRKPNEIHDENWHQRNHEVIMEELNDKVSVYSEMKEPILNDEDKLNNNSMIKRPLDEQQFQRLKPSLSFSPNSTADTPGKCNSGSCSGSLGTNSYGRRRISCSTSSITRPGPSLQRRQAYASSTVYVSRYFMCL